VNTVRGGQTDYASDIPYTIARTGAGADGLEVRTAGAGYGFVLNTTKPLLADPRVRLALRLAVDRKALVDAVFLGYGEPGNDLFGHGAQYFAEDIKLGAVDDTARRVRCTPGALSPEGIRVTASALSSVLEDVEAEVAVAGEHVLPPVRVFVHLDTPEVVAALVDEGADFLDAVRPVLHDAESAGVVGQVGESGAVSWIHRDLVHGQVAEIDAELVGL
jgi:hypothetical protein